MTEALKTLSLNEKQMEMVLACVAACSPTGGGSTQFTLFREMCSQLKMTAEASLIGEMQIAAHTDYEVYLAENKLG